MEQHRKAGRKLVVVGSPPFDLVQQFVNRAVSSGVEMIAFIVPMAVLAERMWGMKVLQGNHRLPV